MSRVPLAAALVLSVACGGDTPPPTAPRAMEDIADEYLAAVIERSATMGTEYSIAGARHDRLFDNSPEALRAWQAREDAWLTELHAMAEPEVGSRDWISYGVMREALEASVGARICRNELWQASTTTAWHTSVPFMFDIQPLDTPDLRGQALSRLGAVAPFIETEIANLRRGLEAGYSAPRVTVEAVPAQVRALLSEDSPFLALATRVPDDPDFGEAVRATFDEQIAPAVERFATFIEDEYLPAAREEIALSANPDGAACYPTLVRSFSTLETPADEIHRLGLEQIARIRSELQQVVDGSFGGGSIEAFLRRVNTDPDFTFDSEDAVLAYSTDALDAARDAMPRAFGRLPRAAVEIKPYPAYAESGSGEYHASSEDGTRPGIFYIAVTDPQGRSRAAQLSTLFHETYPGHHLQVAIALELGDAVHPLSRYLYTSGYSEGWGLYSERLADELGLFTTPIDRVSMLSDQGARAARLVIDSGLHTMGWTRRQAVDYMLANTAWAAVDVENEIDRYISWPAQATSYMLGMLEIRRLRSEAEAELGAAFDLRAFHDRVLGFGNVTLPMLDESIEAWVAEQR